MQLLCPRIGVLLWCVKVVEKTRLAVRGHLSTRHCWEILGVGGALCARLGSRLAHIRAAGAVGSTWRMARGQRAARARYVRLARDTRASAPSTLNHFQNYLKQLQSPVILDTCCAALAAAPCNSFKPVTLTNSMISNTYTWHAYCTTSHRSANTNRSQQSKRRFYV